jgi:cytochrome c
MMPTKRLTVILIALAGVWLGPSALAQEEEESLAIDPSLLAPEQPAWLRDLDPARGRELFVSKGCVICHAVNGVGGYAIRDLGGKVAPSLDAEKMPASMDPFAFFASMWDGAVSMISLQKDRLGYQIKLKGDEIADIMAFLHNREEQEKFTPDSFTPPVFWYRDTSADSER